MTCLAQAIRTYPEQQCDIRVMHIMTGRALDFVIIQFHPIVKTVGSVWWPEVRVLMSETGIDHGDGVVVLQISAEVFDGDVVGNLAVMAFSAAEKVIRAIDAQVKGRIVTAFPAIGPEDGHINTHRAIMAGQAKQADGAGRAYFIIEGQAVIEAVAVGGRGEAVESGDAARGG